MNSKNGFLRTILIVIIAAAALTLWGRFTKGCSAGNTNNSATPVPTSTSSPTDSIYTDDNVGIVSDTTKQLIYDYNETLENDYSGAQLVVLVVKNTGGDSIRDYAKNYFNTKGIGSSTYNNGLLLVVATEDEDYFTTYGSGYADTFAGDLGVILNTYMEPEFAKGNYDTAIATVVPELVNAIKSASSSWK